MVVVLDRRLDRIRGNDNLIRGQFFERFFIERGKFELKLNGEIDVLCPFAHDKGFETRASAHVNPRKGVFHCMTCLAEGRFQAGGLSEIAFFALIHKITYEEAIKLMAELDANDANELVDDSVWQHAVDGMADNTVAIQYLNDRGIYTETIKTYRLGFKGEGISYPVFVYGNLLDIRLYNMTPEPNEPKIKSQKGAAPLLFPFDIWRNDSRPTILVAGENDCLITRQNNFNALTVTAGEGSFPKMFAGMFKGKVVYICYDCDEAGKTGAQRVAFILTEAGATVYLVDLGLQGTKEDKDLTDYFHKHNNTAKDFDLLLAQSKLFSQEDYLAAKNITYPLVDLWEVTHGEHSGKRLSSRVIMSGKFDVAMEAPTAIEWACTKPQDSPICEACKKGNKSGWWTLDESRLDQVLGLVEVTPVQQENSIKKFIGIPEKCPGYSKQVRAKQRVQKVTLVPDVETEDMTSGFKSVETYAYILGHVDMDDGQRYRVYYRRYAHPLQQQRVMLVVDRAEDSDNAVNSFRMTPEIMNELRKFQGDPFVKMKDRFETSKSIVGEFSNEMIFYGTELMFHSALQFRYKGKVMKKGFPEILIVGESRIGKTDTANLLMQFYGIGNLTECKTASVAGILGGVDRLPSGASKIRWGIVPMNHKGLVVMDELSGMPREVMSQLTGLRSSGIATLTKIAGFGRVPALTRLLWISNPRIGYNGQSMNIHDYPTGVHIVLDLVGSDEDIARFDAIMVVAKEKYVQPSETHPPDPAPYRHLVHWAWSRTVDQILWEEGSEDYAWQVSEELNDKYDSDIKLFGAEAWKKLTRLAVSCAASCFACSEDGHSILVGKSHVDWAARFLVRCYDNDLFRLTDYVNSKKPYITTNEEVDAVVASLSKSEPSIIKALSQQTDLSLRQLQAVSGKEPREFNSVIATLTQHYLIQTVKDGIMPTRRFRMAMQNYNKIRHTEVEMQPIQQFGFM